MRLRRRLAVMPLAPGAFCLDGAPAAAPWQDEWLTRFNWERARNGVRPLLPSPVLNQVAQQQAEEMARDGRRLRPAIDRGGLGAAAAGGVLGPRLA